jgi:hypothetical protein
MLLFAPLFHSTFGLQRFPAAHSPHTLLTARFPAARSLSCAACASPAPRVSWLTRLLRTIGLIPTPLAFTLDLDSSGANTTSGVLVAESPGKGLGVFATRDIPCYTTVAEYTGELISQRDVDARYGLEGKPSCALWSRVDDAWAASRVRANETMTGCYVFKVDAFEEKDVVR